MNLKIFAAASVAIAIALPLCPAVAQTPPPKTASDTAPVAAPDAPPKPMSRKEARAMQEKADARLCLEFPTEIMVVKCAEKYRLNKRET